MVFKGILDYCDGSSDFITVTKFIVRENDSIGFEFKTTWSDEGIWLFSGVAKYIGNEKYKVEGLYGKLALDPKIEEKEPADIEFKIGNIDHDHLEIDISGTITYGKDEFPFEGLLEEEKPNN